MGRIQRIANGVNGTQPLTIEERRKAEKPIVMLTQREAFPDTFSALDAATTLLKTHQLYPLDLVLEDDLLRDGGRLRKAAFPTPFKHQAILPKNRHVKRLILDYAHTDSQHQGRGMTLNKLHSLGFWIVGGSKVIAKFIGQCVTCRKLRRLTESQKIADLPKDRVEPTPPFTYCGIDCFEPFLVKQGRKEMKRYGLLITCMCSRAIHIELLDDMSTDSFIKALRCFIVTRGAVRQICSDQGSNFIGAINEFQHRVDSNKLATFLTKRQCKFILNAPHASHTGGVWERQIRTVREILNSVLQLCPGRMDDSSLRTVFYEVMSIGNSRPLTVSEINDPKTLEPLTPNHILTAKADILFPPPGNFVREDLFLQKRVQYLLEQFWSRWKKEYISQISLRQKWHEPRHNMRKGDVVLIKDIELPRNQWPLARVVEANADDDGLVRRVKVRTGCSGTLGSSILERNVQKLVLLVENLSVYMCTYITVTLLQ
ncbi:uncharacterized protein LOC106167786 [Lingula anatina]|uniref:Uncharacterized protein LOC106167786 n=1 Tax=Lingula anatina TaxID=7574 RepID=A0A1S3IX37_LINAN|nr:uncharacterized protein LOC106167786 [Lingula anatina]|eukprot:XP_013402109.1 uncharacterized protein LOC106167786 [Lingula anatina]